ncbi:MAG: rhamnosidase [Planctomycetes bacterium]|nr:rhamnosidase [Planctomycetota bacterium]
MVPIALAFVLTTVPQDPAGGSLRPVGLRCEHLREPLGIEAAQPALSWRLEAVEPGARGLLQTAWQVVVASDAALLANGKADLWDSGKVESSSTLDCEYRGTALRSNQRCFWRVRAWDQQGRSGPWSEVASWSMGLLSPADWQAQWIGYDAPLAARERGADFAGATWLWSPDEKGQPRTGEVCFRGSWDLPANWDGARLLVTADDQCEVWVNGAAAGKSDGQPDAWRRPLVIDAGKLLRPGRNGIAVAARNTGGAGGVLAKLALRIGEKTQVFATDPTWRVAGTAVEGWQQPAFDDRSWPAAQGVGAYGAQPWGRIGAVPLFLPPVRVLGKSFAVREPPRRATLYASALGLYEVELNGRKVGDAFFAPGWTDYDKRVYYQAYDVTAAVRAGANALAVLLADGWHSGYVGYGHARDHYGERTRARVQLVLEHADGSTQVVASDGSWRASTGPLREADFLMGEVCDMTFAPGPPEPVVVSESKALLQRHPGEPVRAIAELRPVSIKQAGDDTWVCDLGQNVAGFARLQVQGRRGQRITLRFAERLNPDGTIYTTNLRSARATDVYVCAGTGVETWQPRFTFHGFQYVEVRGLGKAPEPGTITGVALSSDTPMGGEFACSDPMVDKLVSNIRWTQRMNFIDVPTDCPQRDERLGWTGDAQAYVRTATCLADVQAFFDKWLVDLADAQRGDGQFPMVAPLKVAGGDGGPAWADAGVICPWTIYDVYGDLRLLRRQYPSMVRFVEFCRARSTAELLPPPQFHCFGDWLHIGDPTPNEVIYTAYFAASSKLLAQSAAALGKAEDARKYEELFLRVRAAFQRAYVEADGKVRGHSQTGYVLALAFDLLDGERRAQAERHLLAHLEGRKWHLSTGFVGTKDLMLVLDKIGRDDVAWRLLGNKDFPSWGFTIEHGATSIWERWDGWTPERGFNDPGMNSFAHYAFGAVGQWLFEVAAGVRNEEPGFRRILVRPVPGGSVSWVKAVRPTVHGDVASAWRFEGDRFVLDVTIPPNTTARVVLPTGDPASVRVDGVVPGEVAGVVVDGAAGDGYVVGSGRWQFTAKRR